MLAGCSSLTNLPDISKWNTEKIIDMGYMFSNCSSLKSLPDISKWNIENVINMPSIFYNCRSLISLPYLKKWDISTLQFTIEDLFGGCNLLNLQIKIKLK